MTKVLILSSQGDSHAIAVAAHLEQLDAQVDFFRFQEFIEQCTVTYTIGATKPTTCVLERSEGELDLRSYTSIWHRRPGQLVPGKFVEPWISEMVQKESHSALFGMLRSLPCLWMNFPQNDAAAQSKLWQLQLAAEIGLSIPETLVTNKPDLVRKFFEDCNGEVIYKLMSDQSPFSIPWCETPAGISTLPLRKEDLPFVSQVSYSPHFFQQYIKKKCELRVTVVGKELFCISIDSQSGQSKIDWRNDYTVEMKPFELPKEIKSKCFKLMRKLGLNYGALDFILTEDDRFVFLEINCAGQYLWIEGRTPLQISLSIAKLLAGKSEPLVNTATN